MNKKSILILLLWVLATISYGQTQTDRSLNEVLQTETKLVQAVLRTDTITVSSLLSANYAYTLPDGKIITKKQYLSDIAVWWRPISIEHSEQQVFLYKDTSVVLGRARYRWKNKKGETEEAQEQYTDTYIKIDNKWMRVSSHASCLSGRCT